MLFFLLTMDDALLKVVEANKVALQKLTEGGASFEESSVKKGLKELEAFEEKFLDGVKQAAQEASDRTKEQWKSILDNIPRGGTDTGAHVKETLSAHAREAQAAMRSSREAGLKVMHTLTQNYATLVSGVLIGLSEASQDASPEKMQRLHLALTRVIERDPDVATVGSIFQGGNGGTPNTGRFFIGLRPHDQRDASASQIINRLRPQLAKVNGVTLYLQAAQDITAGGRIAAGQYQYTLQDANIDELNVWAQRILGKLRTLPELVDVSSDQQNNAPQIMVTINREAAARFGIQTALIDATLNDAFGQRQVAQYYTQVNSYAVVLEILQELRRDPKAVEKIYINAPATGRPVPEAACATI